MIIKRLTMTNFGVYAGINSFEFSHKHPIVLIGGMNGRGKTTFLEAILLSLYGANSTAYRESTYKTYGRYLRSRVNKSNRDLPTSIELKFVMNESSNNEYLVRREWDAISKKTEEKIAVWENGNYSDFLTQNWSMFIENILPSALSRFFFFDGEKIAELAVDETSVQMKESIRSMLGISVLDVLKSDLSKILRRLAKSSKQQDGNTAIDSLLQEKETLEVELSDIDTRINQLRQVIEGQRAKIDELHQQYKIKGGDVIEQRQELIQQRSNLLAEIEQNQNALLECASGELPLLMVRDLIGEIKLQAEDEHNDLVMQEAIDVIETLLEEYGSAHPESLNQNAAFVEFVKNTTQSNAVESFYQISDHALFQLNSLLDTLLDQNKINTQQVLKQKYNLRKKLNEIESYLTLDINEKALADLFGAIRSEEEHLVKLEIDLSTLQQQRSTVNSSLISTNAEYSRAVEAYLHDAELLDDTERLTKYSNMALKIAEAYTVELQKRKADILGTTITKCYKQLANKKNLIERIVMDPSTLDIIYLDGYDNEVSKTSLSAGEKQLMVIAILWALATCSKKKLPVIIDTPLSRLDSMHRTSLVKTYFPNASEQTIILSTDSEIDHNYYDMMKESVGDEFTLSYNEDKKCTTILKGYFINGN